MIERRRIVIEGIVQGVGFRPFVYGLAIAHRVTGFVCNDSDGAVIEAEGAPAAVDAFLSELQRHPPPLAAIDSLEWETLPAHQDRAFRIEQSVALPTRHALVSPDTSVCDDCLREMNDPRDRRFGYPFINCTNCGPRFTIIRDIPYDRSQTTMQPFVLCPRCQAEYDDPLNRRFHAQPNACAECGPSVALLDASGAPVVSNNPIAQAAKLIAAGSIVAIKGLGGYHLACDARNEAAVACLRARKHREDKPFALMARDVAEVKRVCHISAAEEALLTTRMRPIVLMPRRLDAALANQVAPRHRDLGLMLPYTPLHHLLLRGPAGLLVMTSANRSDEPIAFKDDDAVARLAGIADYYLAHNREIETRSDDSVVRVSGGHEQFIRRSRGYAPRPIRLETEFQRPVLACGGQLKNTFCLVRGRDAFMSQHIGDLSDYSTLRTFETGVEHMQNLLGIRPEVIAYDLHPDYAATRWALEHDEVVRLEGVQHHHAHIASVMAEQGEAGPVIGVAFDGSGYGPDGAIWGGEFLVATLTAFMRAGHLEYVPLPGGEQAIRGPWRMAAAWLDHLYGESMLSLPLDFVRRLANRPWPQIRQMIRIGLNCPLTSSMGRLFDAVSALLGVRELVNYEGQAAVELEMLADPDCHESYALHSPNDESLVVPGSVFIRPVVNDLMQGVAHEVIAARFHNTVAASIARTCEQIRSRGWPATVALGGGVFQNALLLQRTRAELSRSGFRVLTAVQVPPNDGGLSLGQAAVAGARMAAEVASKGGA